MALTGSEGAGEVVGSQAGKALTKSTLELGGADAFVVLKDADLAKTIDWAVFGRHWNGGQVCVSSRRMIIVDEVYGQFLDLYRKGVAGLVAGDPFDPATTLAPLRALLSEMILGPARLVRDHLMRMTCIGPLREIPSTVYARVGSAMRIRDDGNTELF